MDFPKKQQQCLIPRYLLQYLTSLQMNHDDPTAPWGGGGGGSYTAGDGIEISDEDVISIDDTVALKSDIPSLTGYATETWVTNQGYLVQSDLSDYVTSSELITELDNYVTSTDLATELLNYAELDDIPTKTSDLTNDSGFITSSALTGYATETWVTNQGYSTFSGSYNDLTNKPDLSIYELAADAFSGDYNDLTNKPTIPVVPTNISAFTNDSGYITSSALIGYATESWVSTELLDYAELSDLATVATSGSYNDLTNKPTIPDAVSGTNDGTNWTSLTIGSDTYGLASGSAPANMVTTDTAQSISGVKTFTNEMIMDSTSLGLTKPNGIYFSKLNSCFDKGLYAFDSTSFDPQRVVGGLQFNYVNNITRNGKTTTFEYYTLLNNGKGKEGQNTPSCVGFEVNRSVNGTNIPKYFLAPRPTFGDAWNSAYDTYDAYYIPMVISDGTTNYYANEQGIVTIPAGGSSYTSGTGIDITNDVISVDSTVVALKSDIPTVPTKTSDLTNDSGFITSASLPTKTSDLTNDSGFITNSVNNLTNYFDKTQIQNMFYDTTDVIPVENVDPADYPTAQTQTLTNLYVPSIDTLYTVSGGGGTGPTVTKYNPSSYMDYGYNGARTCNIYDGLLNSDEFRIENTNPGDILLFDITIKYKTQNLSVVPYSSNRYLIKIPVPVKSTNTSYASGHYDVSKSYEMIATNTGASNWTVNFMTLTIENITSASTTNRIVIGELNVPQYIGAQGASGEIIINSITHIAY